MRRSSNSKPLKIKAGLKVAGENNHIYFDLDFFYFRKDWSLIVVPVGEASLQFLKNFDWTKLETLEKCTAGVGLLSWLVGWETPECAVRVGNEISTVGFLEVLRGIGNLSVCSCGRQGHLSKVYLEEMENEWRDRWLSKMPLKLKEELKGEKDPFLLMCEVCGRMATGGLWRNT